MNFWVSRARWAGRLSHTSTIGAPSWAWAAANRAHRCRAANRITIESSKDAYRYSRIRWHQKEADSAVLDWIAAFLREQASTYPSGISPSVAPGTGTPARAGADQR
jgi:hypothetical protein